MSKYLGLWGWILLPLTVGFIGARAEPGAWYASLQKPSWTPPSIAFPIAWTILYILMGIAAGLIWSRGGFSHQRVPLTVFLIQLALNGVWSWIFFGGHQIGWALVDILILWVFILITAVLFGRTLPLAGMLLIPYILWVSFAAVLNFSLWRMN